MDRREFVTAVGVVAAGAWASAVGCRHQYGHILKDQHEDMVGSHTAGAATFNPLIDEAVAKLLGRQQPAVHVAADGQPIGCRVCFVGVENRSAEELGDFHEQIYEQIDTRLIEAESFQPISRRFVDAALDATRLRPDELFLPQNMQTFTAVLQQQGQPIDYLLFATLTSGTTTSNHDTQRDYLLTLEIVDIATGQADKQSAKIRKGYHKTRLGKLRHYNPFQR